MGERGKVIIETVLQFGLEDVEMGANTLLTRTKFFECILVPTIALLIIEQDLELSPCEAFKVMQDSAKAGYLVHQSDENDHFARLAQNAGHRAKQVCSVAPSISPSYLFIAR